MSDISVFIYLIFFVMVFASTFAFMWRMMSSTLREMDRKPTRSYGDSMRAYQPPAPHPEMEGVRTGEELLVYTPEDEDDDDDDDGDIPLYTGENI